jgi:hypothetical protein
VTTALVIQVLLGQFVMGLGGKRTKIREKGTKNFFSAKKEQK